MQTRGKLENLPILIVDDDPEILWALAYFLEDLGYETTLASNASAAKEILNRGQIHWSALITDFNMPGENGLELIKAAKKTGIEFDQVILISAAHNLKASEKALRKENIRTLRKPFSCESLLHALGWS